MPARIVHGGHPDGHGGEGDRGGDDGLLLELLILVLPPDFQRLLGFGGGTLLGQGRAIARLGDFRNERGGRSAGIVKLDNGLVLQQIDASAGDAGRGGQRTLHGGLAPGTCHSGNFERCLGHQTPLCSSDG